MVENTEVARIAAGLIARERDEARTGLAVFAGIVVIGTGGAAAFSAFVLHRSAPYAVPVGLALAFVLLGFLLRIGRVGRYYLRARRHWRAGQLSNGEPATDAARRIIAARQPIAPLT